MKLAVYLIALPLAAHTVSLSTGELELDGAAAQYTVRIPAHEMDHIREPERTVLGSIELAGARLAERRCAADGSEFVCAGRYVYASPPERMQVTVRLAQSIVETHVHVLEASRGEQTARAVFTASQPQQELTFGRSIHWRPWVIASLVAFTLFWLRRWWAAFAAGAAVSLLLPWSIAPGFGELAVAIIAAYCLFEAWYVRSQNYRWIASAALGIMFALYARSSEWL